MKNIVHQRLFLSIERQRCAVFVVVHACEVILRVYAPRPATKEFLACCHGAWSHGFYDTTESDLREVWLCPSNLNELELVREYPCPIRDEVAPREGNVRIAAGDHLGKIAMHDAQTTWEASYLGCE